MDGQQFTHGDNKMSLTATQKKSGWNEIPFGGYDGLPSWVYNLSKGDELLKRDGGICIFDRAMQKNIAFYDDQGKGWSGKPWGFIAWRKGDPSKITRSAPVLGTGYKTDEAGASDLKPGDVALFIMGPRRVYIARVEDRKFTGKTISARDINGKGYRYPKDAFVCKLPAELFPL